MWAILRVVIFDWILARLSLRWLASLAILVPLALVFFVGIPALLVTAGIIFLAWRLFRRAPASAEAPPA